MLTPKQNAFAEAYVATGNASEAYRRSYDAERMALSTIHVRASELLRHSGVAVRIEELRAQIAIRNGIKFDEIARGLRSAASGAMAEGQWSAAVTALMGLAKLGGLLIEKREIAPAANQDHLSAIKNLAHMP